MTPDRPGGYQGLTAFPAAAGPDAGAAQRQAARPDASVWVSASAGSGKTKVLTDRVLALLLEETSPERILCLTFTRAAAAEMANRIRAELTRWTFVPDEDLRARLASLLPAAPDAADIARARRLLARVLDVPGGLKILTLHGFCQSLLGRFPLEAGVAPHFETLDERSADELLRTARDQVLIAGRAGGRLGAAIDAVTAHVPEDRFGEVLAALISKRADLHRLLDRYGGVAPMVDAVYARLGVARDATCDGLVAAACADTAFDGPALRRACAVLAEAKGKSDPARGAAMAEWLAADPAGRARTLLTYVQVFLTTEGKVRKVLATKPSLAAWEALLDVMEREAERVCAHFELCRALTTAQATEALLVVGHAIVAAYEREKSVRARLDYDDLIDRTLALLNERADAAWVLFKLDGGLDHILIDEAQDTNREQWAIVQALAEEFFAGEGRTPRPRTVFAVGDAKQSIFSFQRADPAAFAEMRSYFADRVRAAGERWREVPLDTSFRSTPAVLAAVDAVFADAAARQGVADGGRPIVHRAHRAGMAGLVELWPPAVPREGAEPEAWVAPIARTAADSPRLRLARVVARHIHAGVGTTWLEARGRPLRAGDVMILVRRRDAFVEELVRTLKQLGVPVAGVDRMVLSDQLVVEDMAALGGFLLLPEDDLTLAVVLKGPLLGLDDDDLFALAQDRGCASLWQQLRAAAERGGRFSAARDWLANLLRQIDFRPPYELFAAALNGPCPAGPTGRQAILARLGPEAEDPLEEFMGLALAYERAEPPSLQGFLQWLRAGDVTVKRDLEQAARDEVRVMTVHGAKGLQAPVVYLPDTTAVPRDNETLMWTGDLVLWPPRREHEEQVCGRARAEAARRREEEYRRLLYVAMTRAEDRLHICGWHGKTAPGADSWYAIAARALPAVAATAMFDFTALGEEGWQGEGLRLTGTQTSPAAEDGRAAAVPLATAEMESWMAAPAPAEEAPPRPLAPSAPGEEPPVTSPLAEGGARFRRGILIHRLLQFLPDLPVGSRAAAAARYLARPVHKLSAADQTAVAAEVLAVLDTPDLAVLFGPGSRAEAPLVGVVETSDGPQIVSGQVDRLAVRDDAVHVVDYKSQRPVPASVEAVPAVYLRQMAAYRAVLQSLWPERRIACALLWTDGPSLMALPEGLLDRYYPAT